MGMSMMGKKLKSAARFKLGLVVNHFQGSWRVGRGARRRVESESFRVGVEVKAEEGRGQFSHVRGLN